jgi:hypothetical protein
LVRMTVFMIVHAGEICTERTFEEPLKEKQTIRYQAYSVSVI